MGIVKIKLCGCVQNSGRFAYIFKNAANDNLFAKFCVKVAILKIFRKYFDGIKHCDRHRFLNFEYSVTVIFERDNLQFPRTKIRRWRRIER